MGYLLLAGKHFDNVGAIFDDLMSNIEKPERDTKIPYVRFISAILHFFPGQKYPTDGDCNFSKVGPRVLKVKPAENEVCLQTLRLLLSTTSSTSVVTPMVHSSAIPTTTTPLKRQSSALSGPSKKAKKTKESTPSLKEPEVVSQQTTLDDFVGRSSTSATTTTVPVTTIAVTPPVINPTSPVSQIAEVITLITSVLPSIPITSPFTSLVTNLPNLQHPASIVANTGPAVVQTSQPFSPFEGDMHFFNMFENSGPTLGTVDANINKLVEKVESLVASLDTNTTAVNQAGEELMTLASATATKADPSQLSSLQVEVNQLKDNMARNSNQLQFLTGHVDHLIGEVHALNIKMESANQLLSQLLAKLNEPTPALTPSFTHDNRLEVDAYRTPAADVAAPTNVIPHDDDKEGEMNSEENTMAEAQVAVEEPPSQSEGEKIVEVSAIEVQEDLDLQDQEDDDAADDDDDDDDDEDPSLWGRQKDSASVSSSQGKQKGIAVEGNLKLLSPSEGEQPSQFSPLLKGTPSLQIIPALTTDEQIIPTSLNEVDEQEEEEDETLLHPGRPSRPAQWSKDELKRRTEMISHLEKSVITERLLADCQKDVDFALKVQASMFKDDKMKENAVVVHAAILKEIEEERLKEKEASDKSLDWCKQKIDYRSDPMKIVAFTISGRKKKERTSVTMEITREDGSSKAIAFISSTKAKANQKKLVSSSSDNVAVIKNDTSIKFSKEALFGPPPNLSVLDLSLPSGGPFIPGKVLKNPFGIFFIDDESQLRFQRVSEIPLCPLNHLKDLLCLWCTYSPSVEPIKTLI
ncbi:hypothetical protein L6452_09036 [Arctium lappa]|uniref:Uncharacterized protein n=1 Tax=Arctium lappa TaxID=4217 RepID=A0ACB9DIX9_ARCLA|nr:hypothetical protein L6452_09036 [Arctium lappa]